jgi:hypothetical protein
VILLGGACASDTSVSEPPAPIGPPRVRLEVVQRHGRELAGELEERSAGSQEEQAAAIYILGHIQRAGYTVRLDGVPVSNLVRSTNVIALPPGGGEPHVVVAVSYDRGPAADGGGEETVGTWLELARALRAVRPLHAVEFAALGAEHARVRGGELGSKVLVQDLRDEDIRPLIVTLDADTGTGGVTALGPGATEVMAIARRMGIAFRRTKATAADAFTAAGLDHLHVGGGTAQVGRVMLEYLSSDAQ